VTGKVTPPATLCQKKTTPDFEVVPLCPSRGTRQTRLPHSRAVVVRQPCTPVLTCTSEQRNFATKPPFAKGRFGGNVNITIYTQKRLFSGLRLPSRGKAKEYWSASSLAKAKYSLGLIAVRLPQTRNGFVLKRPTCPILSHFVPFVPFCPSRGTSWDSVTRCATTH
jgi:hypothetical protein